MTAFLLPSASRSSSCCRRPSRTVAMARCCGWRSSGTSGTPPSGTSAGCATGCCGTRSKTTGRTRCARARGAVPPPCSPCSDAFLLSVTCHVRTYAVAREPLFTARFAPGEDRERLQGHGARAADSYYPRSSSQHPVVQLPRLHLPVRAPQSVWVPGRGLSARTLARPFCCVCVGASDSGRSRVLCHTAAVCPGG